MQLIEFEDPQLSQKFLDSRTDALAAGPIPDERTLDRFTKTYRNVRPGSFYQIQFMSFIGERSGFIGNEVYAEDFPVVSSQFIAKAVNPTHSTFQVTQFIDTYVKLMLGQKKGMFKHQDGDILTLEIEDENNPGIYWSYHEKRTIIDPYSWSFSGTISKVRGNNPGVMLNINADYFCQERFGPERPLSLFERALNLLARI